MKTVSFDVLQFFFTCNISQYRLVGDDSLMIGFILYSIIDYFFFIGLAVYVISIISFAFRVQSYGSNVTMLLQT